MIKNKKNYLILLISTCILFMSIAIFFFISSENIKKDKISFKSKFEELTMNREDLIKDIKKIEEIKKIIEQELDESKKNVEEVSLQLNEERNKNIQLISDMIERENEIKRLKTDVLKYQTEHVNILKSFESLSKDYNDIKIIYDELLEEKEKSKKKIKELNETINRLTKEKKSSTSLGTIVLR